MSRRALMQPIPLLYSLCDTRREQVRTRDRVYISQMVGSSSISAPEILLVTELLAELRAEDR